MGLNLSEEVIDALEIRTEGWIAGLQMAALSMQGREDTASFIQAFTGSHHLILDYLIEEVLQSQPAHQIICIRSKNSIHRLLKFGSQVGISKHGNRCCVYWA